MSLKKININDSISSARSCRSEDRKIRSRRHKQEFKEQLSVLATEIKNNINENQFLNEMIKVKKQCIKKNKLSLRKYASNQKIPHIDVEHNLTNDNIELSFYNKSILTEKNKLKQKYSKLRFTINQTIEGMKNELRILLDRKFIYENALKERDCVIHELLNQLTFVLNFPLAREEVREIYSDNVDLAEDEIIDTYIKYQECLLIHSKQYNKYHNKCKKLKEELDNLAKFFLKRRRQVFSTKGNNNKINFIENNNNYLEIENCSSLLNDTIKSEAEYEYDFNYDEICFTDLEYLNKKEDKNLQIIKRSKIPKIDLKQIEYNKKKISEEKEKSLSREINKKGVIDNEIKKLKDCIKKAKKNNKLKKAKIQEFELKIRKMENILKIYDNLPIANHNRVFSCGINEKREKPVKLNINQFNNFGNKFNVQKA